MLADLTSISAALSDPTRVRILASLLGGRDEELCVCEVTDLFDLAPSTVSKHLLILRQAGLVEGRKDGRWMYYRPTREPGPLTGAALGWVRKAAGEDERLRSDATKLRAILAAEAACCGGGSRCGTGGQRTRVLFLCTGNSCRSQMAEGWARSLLSDRVEAFSAGTRPHGVNPLALRVMREAGVDISRQTSKHVDELLKGGLVFDVVVTVCDSAHEACPVLPGSTRVVHVEFDAPPRLAEGAKSDDEALPHYRRVRDEIRAFIGELPARLGIAQSEADAS